MNARYHIKRQKVSTMPTWLLMKTNKNGETTEASSFTSRISLICDLCDLMFRNEISRQMIYEVVQNMPIEIPFADLLQKGEQHFAFQNNPLYQIDNGVIFRDIAEIIAKTYHVDSSDVSMCHCYVQKEFDGGVVLIKLEDSSLFIGPEKSIDQTLFWAKITECLMGDIFPNYVGVFAEYALKEFKRTGCDYPQNLN